LTHLILNGMVKVKGQLGEIAKCLEDEDARISDLAKLFFTELATKDNAVYNNMPDIISHLSMGEHAVSEEAFARIIKFLFEFIKDKQSDNMVDKLCQRFKNTNDARQWRDTSFCLSLLPYKNERSIKKLMDALPLYQETLFDDVVYKHFGDMLVKARQLKASKAEAKATIEEFEAKLKEQRELAVNNAQAMQKATMAMQVTASPRVVKKPVPLPKLMETSDDEVEQEEEVAMEVEEVVPPPTVKKTARRRLIVDSSEDEVDKALDEAADQFASLALRTPQKPVRSARRSSTKSGDNVLGAVPVSPQLQSMGKSMRTRRGIQPKPSPRTQSIVPDAEDEDDRPIRRTRRNHK
jgi:hypothetical protein